MAAERFAIHFPDADISDLRDRLKRTRFAGDLDNADWRYGVPTSELRGWVDAWRDFDFRGMETRLNAVENYRVEIDGVLVHFVYRRGSGPNPIPLIVTHGWPWTYWDWIETLGPLTDPAAYGGDPSDAFDVVIPSLPGFGFSDARGQPTGGIARTAELWLKLMTEVLGYDRFAAAGGDQGNTITAHLGHAWPERIIGLHLLGAVPFAGKPHPYMIAGKEWDSDWGFERPANPPADPILAAEPLTAGAPVSAHRIVHAREPHTLSAGLHDSPAGMMAWLLMRRHFWRNFTTDVRTSFSEEFLLTTFSLYWLTETFWTSVRSYRERADAGWAPVHDRSPLVEAPTGITFFEFDQTSRSRFWVEDYYNLVRIGYSPTGGHFAPAEVPNVVVDEIRHTFRLLR